MADCLAYAYFATLQVVLTGTETCVSLVFGSVAVQRQVVDRRNAVLGMQMWALLVHVPSSE